MTVLAFTKTVGGGITPADDTTREFVAQKLKTGQILHGEFTRMRNYQFHKRFFALMQLGFEVWEDTRTPVQFKGHDVAANLERFRKDITILAGYYEQTVRLDGSIRTEAKSISFGNMGQEEFEALYSACIQVILDKVLVQPMTPEELRNRVDQVLEMDR